MKNARLIIAIITSLLDEAIIVALILWGLPKLGIEIPLFGMVLIVMAFAAYAIITFKLGSRILRKKPVPGFTDMVGMEGRSINRLNPKGFVRIQGEIWESRSENGIIKPGIDIIVVDQYGLKLVVRPKQATELSNQDD